MQLNVQIVQAIRLPKLNFFGSINPYCEIRYGVKSFKTKRLTNTMNPKWHATLSIPVDQNQEFVYFYIKNHKLNGSKKVGRVKININDIPYMQVVDKLYQIEPHGHIHDAGKLRLKFHLCNRNDKPFVQRSAVAQQNNAVYVQQQYVVPQYTDYSNIYQQNYDPTQIPERKDEKYNNPYEQSPYEQLGVYY